MRLRSLPTLSTVLLKQVMAVTGVFLFGFVLVHMAGNLQVFRGREAYNAYAAGLKSLGPLLWVARLGLLAIFLVHVGTALQLVVRNRRARPVPYAMRRSLASSYASQTMPMSGLLVLAFVVFHLLHHTWGATHPAHFALVDDLGRHDVYNMVVLGFRHVPTTIFYILAMLVLGLHLGHGLSSLFQSLGLNAPRYSRLVTWTGRGLATLVVVGNLSMPLACVMGWVPLVGVGVAS